LTHTHLSAVLKAVTENNITYDQIDEVTITTIARACDILFDPHKYRPDSRETADHSLPYCVAVALVDHRVTTQAFTEEKLKDERIWQVIDKIKGQASQEFERMFPAKQPSRVVVRTADGKTYEEYLEYPKGDPREPMTMVDLEAKFNALSADLLSPDRQAKIEEMIFSCDDMSASSFMAALAVR